MSLRTVLSIVGVIIYFSLLRLAQFFSAIFQYPFRRTVSNNNLQSFQSTREELIHRNNQFEDVYQLTRQMEDITGSIARIVGSAINGNARRMDTHHHIVPDFYAQAVASTGGDPSGWTTPQWSVEQAKQTMSLLGIRTAVVSITAPGTKIYEEDFEKSRRLARRLNEYSADLVKSDPDKFAFFASLPTLLDVEGTISEIEYAHSILKADGFTLFSSYGHGQYLGHPSFRPIWFILNQMKAVVFIHPSEAPTTTVNRFMPQPLIDYPQETTRTASDLVLTGTRAAFPDVKIILSHAGGTIPFLVQRIAGAGIIPSLQCPRNPLQILKDFRSFYYDTALSSSAAQLKALLEFADHSKILFGSDVPYASLPASLFITQGLDLFFNGKNNQELQTLWEQINWKNAKALFPQKITD